MDNIFEFDKNDLKEYLLKDYRLERYYNKDLDVNYDLEMAEGEKGAEKSIKTRYFSM